MHPDLRLNDEQLLALCEVHTYRASGPGGQKRNKTESAVRIKHRPTEIMAIAEESRSQHQNRRSALRRLRRAIALRDRGEPETPPQEWPEFCRGGRLDITPKNPAFNVVLAYVLDVFQQGNGRLRTASESLGISTGQLNRFLRSSRDLWQAANQIRVENGLKALK